MTVSEALKEKIKRAGNFILLPDERRDLDFEKSGWNGREFRGFHKTGNPVDFK